MTFFLFQLGIKQAFEGGEFENILETVPLKVDQISHRALIEVTKDGTVGAAATTIEIVALSGIVEEKQLVIDKPFIFAVYDHAQFVPLFVGKYTNPNL